MNTSSRLVVANWKLNPGTLSEAKKIFTAEAKGIPRGVTAVICPPALFLGDLMRLRHGNSLFFGLQNVFWESTGAFTGEYSAEMAKSMEVTYAIVGHSERRALGETDAMISSKVVAVLKTGLTAVVCVGERERDEHGAYLPELEKQIKASLAGVVGNLSNLVIAYEPIWAIGKGARFAMSGRDLHETVNFIHKVLHDRFGKTAVSVPVLYGGSVAPENAGALVAEGNVKGFLVGGQSLKPEAFKSILTAVSEA